MAAISQQVDTNEMEGGPPTKLMLRDKNGVKLMLGPRGDKNLSDKDAISTCDDKDHIIEEMKSDLCLFSPNGMNLVRLTSNSIEILNTEDNTSKPILITDIPLTRVQKFAWSPKSNFLVTWHKPDTTTPTTTGTDNDKPIGNLRVYEASTGKLLSHFSMKKISSMSWPVLQWTSDESLCLHLVTNEVSPCSFFFFVFLAVYISAYYLL